MNRRKFISQLSLISAAALPVSESIAALTLKSKQKMAYSAITWNGNDLVAIKEIAALGFKGIQLRANTYPVFKDAPQDLRTTIESNGLKMPMFSSGNISINDYSKDLETQLNHARFVKAVGGECLQFTNSARPKDRPPTTQELKDYAKNMSAVAKAVKEETGLHVAYHNHMHQLGETPEEVDIIVNEMNPDYIRLLLDVAHYHQGGGVPADAVLKYKKVLYATHIKDTRPDQENKSGYRFVELGQGAVDFPAVFKNLDSIGFKGWNIVELDSVPVKGRTALDSGKISKEYLSQKIGIQF